MVLGEVIGVKAAAVIGLDEAKPLFILARQRHGAAIHVIEDAEPDRHQRAVRPADTAPKR